MNFKHALSLFVAAATMAIVATPSFAAKHAKSSRIEAVTGLAASHDLRREGNRICFADHYHYGSSAGVASKRAAEIAAIESWSGFVDFEYGGDWAHFSKAASKSMKCGAAGGSWSCDLSARPCR